MDKKLFRLVGNKRILLNEEEVKQVEIDRKNAEEEKECENLKIKQRENSIEKVRKKLNLTRDEMDIFLGKNGSAGNVSLNTNRKRGKR